MPQARHDSPSPRRTGRADFPHPALTKTVVGQLRPGTRRRLRPQIKSSVSVESVCSGSSYFVSRSPEFRSVGFPKRHSLPLTRTRLRSGPFAPRSLPASSLLWACPTPVPARLRVMSFPTPPEGCPPTGTGLPGSSTDLSLRAVPFHPGEPSRCSHPLLPGWCQASASLADWPLSLCVTRPNRVHLRYGSQVHLARLRQLDHSSPRLLGYLANGQFPG
jgi:hypothetical protein